MAGQKEISKADLMEFLMAGQKGTSKADLMVL